MSTETSREPQAVEPTLSGMPEGNGVAKPRFLFSQWTSMDAWPPDRRELAELNNRLSEMKSRVRGLHARFEAGPLTIDDLENFFRSFLGDHYHFPLESLPPEKEMCHQCIEHQFEQKGKPLNPRIPELPFARGKERHHEIDLVKRQIFTLTESVRWVSLQRGHDICWEHIEWLSHLCLALEGKTTDWQRPVLRRCQILCMKFVADIHQALRVRQKEEKGNRDQ